jgi:hypothetical protein
VTLAIIYLRFASDSVYSRTTLLLETFKYLDFNVVLNVSDHDTALRKNGTENESD